MNRPLIRFAATTLIAALGITTAFAGSGGGTRLFAGESIPVVDKAIVKPAPQPKQKSQPQQKPATRSNSGTMSTTPATKPNQGPNSKPNPGSNSKPPPGPNPKPGPNPRPAEAVGVVYYTDGFEVNIGQVQQAAQELQPLLDQVMQNMPSAEDIQEMARQLQGPVSQQVEQAAQQLPQSMQEILNEPIIITPQSANEGNSKNSKTKRSSKWTYGVPGMTGGEGNGPLIYNP